MDRADLARQADKEFKQYIVPGDGRKFNELHNVHIRGAAGIRDEIKVSLSSVQRLYSQRSGMELDDNADERSDYEIESNTLIPIETFDIIIDECHRSIDNLWSGAALCRAPPAVPVTDVQ